MKFVHGRLKYFNETILKLERENASVVDVAHVLSELKPNLLEKKENNFIPSQAMFLLGKLEEVGEVNAKKSYKVASTFYVKCVSCLDVMTVLVKMCILIFGLTLKQKYSGNKCLNQRKNQRHV